MKRAIKNHAHIQTVPWQLNLQNLPCPLWFISLLNIQKKRKFSRAGPQPVQLAQVWRTSKELQQFIVVLTPDILWGLIHIVAGKQFTYKDYSISQLAEHCRLSVFIGLPPFPHLTLYSLKVWKHNCFCYWVCFPVSKRWLLFSLPQWSCTRAAVEGQKESFVVTAQIWKLGCQGSAASPVVCCHATQSK